MLIYSDYSYSRIRIYSLGTLQVSSHPQYYPTSIVCIAVSSRLYLRLCRHFVE